MNQIPCASESVEQQCLFRWAAAMQNRWPELRLIYHVPNEGKRTRITGAQLNREGMRAGVPDIFLPVARGGFHGLFIEMKRMRGGRVSPEQKWWMEQLNGQQYRAVVCFGWEHAVREIESYLEGENDARRG